MSIYVRAYFDFKDEKNGIKHCTGYVVCEDVTPTEYGCDFKVHSVVIKKLIAKKPDFEKLEQLAIQNCKVFDDEIINVGSLAEHHD
jgi:hypothetical protein